jgi:hypothetical protein
LFCWFWPLPIIHIVLFCFALLIIAYHSVPFSNAMYFTSFQFKFQSQLTPMKFIHSFI